ncbi:MAG: hypothetical protein EBY74_05060 [Actinobacteria bacterium]|nr:hypothetical protein [Actinomycetota bacterium]
MTLFERAPLMQMIIFFPLAWESFTLIVDAENVKLSAVKLSHPSLSVTEVVAIFATPFEFETETEAVTGAAPNPYTHLATSDFMIN